MKSIPQSALIAVLLSIPLSSQAQFGDFLKSLQKPQQQQAVSGTRNSNTQAGGLMSSDGWCKQQVGTLNGADVDTSLIASEFNIQELESLQDEFLKAFRKNEFNKTFPNAKFFRASFETQKVRSLYDIFLAFPEPDILAALIKLSRGNDQQERADALMALTFLHLQAPQLSANKNLWWAHFQSALGTEHFTALVFKARINAYGEYAPKNLAQAVGDLVSAGALRSKYRMERQEFDSQNYELIHFATAKDIFDNEPNMPYRQQWAGSAKTAKQIEQAQSAYAAQLPNTRIGKLYAQANLINEDSIRIGNEIIKSTQGGNQLVGQITSLQSLKSNTKGEKQVVEDSSPEIQQAQLKMISKVTSLDDKQKVMLVAAQEKRLIAQGIISQSYGELIKTLTSGFGDMVKMAAPLPALAQANNALIQSCVISAKWEQAMRAKDIPNADIKKAETAVADLSSKYKD